MSHVTSAARPALAMPQTEAPQMPRPVQPSLAGGGRIMPIIPQDLDQVVRLAGIIARSGAAPDSYRSEDGHYDVDMIAAAIMVGLEVGLAPMAAVSGIVMMESGPAIWGDARDGLVAASGLLLDMKEEIELDAAGIFTAATCTVWRKDRPTPIVQTVTRGQAEMAGWMESEVWKTNPNRMAQMRAKGWANRDAFPDVLKGLRSHDEAADLVDVTARGAATTAPPAPRRADFAAPEPKVDAPAVAEATQEDLEPLGADAPPEGWPLYDETGETVGTHPTFEWIAVFARMAGDLDGLRTMTAIDNNRETATKVVAEVEASPVILRSADYDFVKMVAADDPLEGEKPARMPLAAGQTACAEWLVDQINAANTVADLNRIVRVNIEHVKGWLRSSRDRVFAAQDARLDHLQAGGVR